MCAVICVTEKSGKEVILQPKVFGLFLSTKTLGNVIGIGISISSVIIKKHRGWCGMMYEVRKCAVIRIYLSLADKNLPLKGGVS